MDRPIPSAVHRCTDKRVGIIRLGRCIGGQAKDLTPVHQPQQIRLFPGKRCEMVIGHQGVRGGAGHWLAFVNRNNTWWKLDTSRIGPVVEDPYEGQMKPHEGISGAGYTRMLHFGRKFFYK